MKKLFLIKVFIFLVYASTLGQSILSDSIYIYDENKQKDWYYIQKDVINVNLTDNSILNINLPDYVDTIYNYDNSYSVFNTICFSNESTEMERLNFINTIINLTNFNSIALEISREQETYDKYKHYPTDDLIMVTFKDPGLSLSEIESFGQKYNLTLVYTPSPNLPSEVSWTYVFQNKTPRSIEYTSIYLSNIINENESDLVELAEPNTFSVKPYSCDVPIEELSDSPDNNNYTWYIQNDGGDIYNGDIGTPDADADICECWEEGLTGNGIKIGIIDFGGFEVNHPDFIGADVPFIYDATTQQKHFGESFYYTNDSTTWSHAMLVAGTIISQPNNINNQNGYSIGVAHNATFYPYLCGNKLITGQSNNHILNAIHQAMEDKVDVLNMSFGLGTPGTLSGQLANAIATGRPSPNNPNQKRGMVVVAAIGNDNKNLAFESASIFPANQARTIGVGYSTPEDYRATTSNGEGDYLWGMQQNEGSHYGPIPLHFDVVAPGVVIRSTNYINGEGNGYLVRSGSSLASPIVASIVALILEEKPSLTYDEVQNVIRNGAEKVHSTQAGGPYPYGTDGSGYNNKMFYGRVSCINSLKLATSLGIEQEAISSTVIKHIDQGIYVIETEYSTSKNVLLYSLDGRLLFNETVQGENIEINLNSFPKGIYLLKINNQEYRFATKLIH